MKVNVELEMDIDELKEFLKKNPDKQVFVHVAGVDDERSQDKTGDERADR